MGSKKAPPQASRQEEMASEKGPLKQNDFSHSSSAQEAGKQQSRAVNIPAELFPIWSGFYHAAVNYEVERKTYLSMQSFRKN